MSKINHTILVVLLSLSLATLPFSGVSAGLLVADNAQHCYEVDMTIDTSATHDTVAMHSYNDCCDNDQKCNDQNCNDLNSCHGVGHGLSLAIGSSSIITLPIFLADMMLALVNSYQSQISSLDTPPPVL